MKNAQIFTFSHVFYYNLKIMNLLKISKYLFLCVLNHVFCSMHPFLIFCLKNNSLLTSSLSQSLLTSC